MQTKKFTSSSSKETKDFGKALARAIRKEGPKPSPIVFALEGMLGSGKTTFVQGFLSGFGVRKRVQSPTFVVIRRYRLPAKKDPHFKNVFHMDAYRLKAASKKDGRHLGPIGFWSMLEEPGNIVFVEWPERLKGVLPRNARWIAFSHGAKENERIITTRHRTA
ncbi:MAG TPA: tRNA (adenosine(37)-N6)-threonylcarbamoyltransferase complex ATPase subunit type 1 TsaE [Candidatus Paceibacterota bacterium]|nr:tRNA (adenosine(37)-N6)-threonylcarbamoyltransferase complex ATPase subunit type 1 TsaE [Candidatus Paceibacterota bacterium]